MLEFAGGKFTCSVFRFRFWGLQGEVPYSKFEFPFYLPASFASPHTCI
jgi:hypothetical protein